MFPLYFFPISTGSDDVSSLSSVISSVTVDHEQPTILEEALDTGSRTQHWVSQISVNGYDPIPSNEQPIHDVSSDHKSTGVKEAAHTDEDCSSETSIVAYTGTDSEGSMTDIQSLGQTLYRISNVATSHQPSEGIGTLRSRAGCIIKSVIGLFVL